MKLFGTRRIYLDYAGATPVDTYALSAVMRASDLLGNPGAIHSEGVRAADLLEDSRRRIALEFGVKARELIFTSGGTEANNLAILGIAHRRDLSGKSIKGTHWVASSIEHPSVLECFAQIERAGGTVSHVDPDSGGVIRPEAVANVLKPETVCVSVGWGNGEIGVAQPISDIARVIRQYEVEKGAKILFHSDAGQAPLYLPTVIHSLGVDLLTLDAAKLYGPRGIGALYVGPKAEIASILYGGPQERDLRPGTENVALAAGFAEALVQNTYLRKDEATRLRTLRDAFEARVLEAIPAAVINGDKKHMLPHMLNISIPDIDSEYLTLALDHAGVALSTKSACREGHERRSHVVEALCDESDEWRSSNTLRFSLGRGTTARELENTATRLRDLLQKRKRVDAKEEE